MPELNKIVISEGIDNISLTIITIVSIVLFVILFVTFYKNRKEAKRLDSISDGIKKE